MDKKCALSMSRLSQHPYFGYGGLKSKLYLEAPNLESLSQP